MNTITVVTMFIPTTTTTTTNNNNNNDNNHNNNNNMPNLPTNIVDFRGLDSSIILI